MPDPEPRPPGSPGPPPPSSGGPPVFVVGCGRSGTTMLRLMLDAHPELAIPGESHFLITLWKQRRRYRRNDRFDVEAMVRDAMRSHQFRYWSVPEADVLRRTAALSAGAGFAEGIDALYMAYADLHGKRRWGDKTPQYVRSIALLARIFPDSRFVHVIRDGRDVALSYLSLRWGPPNIWRAAHLWSHDVTAGRTAGRRLGPSRYVEVRYESLVEDPEQSLREACRCIQVDFDPVMLEYHRTARDRIDARPDRTEDHASATRPLTEGMRDWRTQMKPADVEVFEAVAGSTLSALGYERRVPRIAAAQRTYAWVRSRLVMPRLRRRRKIRSQPKRRPSDLPSAHAER